MLITVVGCGDAFGSGGRFNTCYLVQRAAGAAPGQTLALDFGASSLLALKQRQISPRTIGGVLISHLHGDHFGGLPFLLLDAQFDCGRIEPLTIMGPPGTKARLDQLLEVVFAGSSATQWHFKLDIIELPLRTPATLCGYDVESIEVVHPSGAPSTGVRVSDGDTLLGFGGDSTWTESLIDIARGADLMILECLSFSTKVPAHLDFPTLQANRIHIDANMVMLTHMGPSMLAERDAIEAAGYIFAQDGLVIEL